MPSLSDVSPEVISQILYFLPPASLRRLRCVNKHIGDIATVHAFRHIRLEALLRRSSPEAFSRIARSDKLRNLVREISCDTCLQDEDRDEYGEPGDVPTGFMNSLPLLRFFKNVNTLNVRFNKSCAHTTLSPYDNPPKESTDFRYRVLDTVFQCIAGTWSVSRQQQIDGSLDLDFDANYHMDESLVGVSVGPLPLKKLAVCNLGDYNDERLTKSEAFKTALASTKLAHLQLLITVQGDWETPEYHVQLPDQYELFESLPNTWLSPAVAQNLTTLSLYCHHYWGWSPKMDFRAVRPGNGPDAGFPNLKVLALGKYVFSHAWQVDWFASLGKLNGLGGLRELYLDDCPIMYQATYLKPLDNSSVVIGQDADGHDITISNEGYQKKDVLTLRRGTQRGRGNLYGEKDYPLRWHSVLTRWREEMTAIQVFKMGHGSLDRPPAELLDAFYDAGTDYDGEIAVSSDMYADAAFQCYDAPSPPPEGTRPETIQLQKYAKGSGLSQDRKYLMQYAYFGGEMMISLRSMRGRGNLNPKLEKDTDVKDEAALELFLSSIGDRRR